MTNRKLFVVGEKSGNPDEWTGPYCLVVALTPEEAISIADDECFAIATEVNMGQSAQLAFYEDNLDHWERGLALFGDD